ncbi:uncharacterized protein LOC128282036 [Gossypium arboreum]|uniref:uncharacterized protein LOC128282036 n=1 Tax=Gossypium arboreum TaxID=29729 RepID=UPI0022F1B99C|nr:uncharacterized protein LOC128282036 [Gossypium arboreum]
MRAKIRALELVQGNHKGQYANIYDYLLELRRSNPGTTTICKLDCRLFQRLYICLEACKSVAFAAVESENKQSWFWFLELLQRDLEIDNSYNICFMSDKQKIILEARDKPILTMLEIIRRKVITRLVSMREAAEKYPGPLCPRIQKKLFEIVSQFNNIWPVYAGNEKYEVDCGLGNKHVVDLLNSSFTSMNPETYVNTCYTVTTQLNIYSHLINPVKGPMQWEHVRDMEPILPPIIRRPLGRPKQTRRKEVGEERKSGPKLSKIGQQANCTKCGKPGHNTRTCKGIIGSNQMASQSSSLQISNQATSMDNTSSQPPLTQQSQPPLTQQSSNLTANFRAKLPFKRKFVL